VSDPRGQSERVRARRIRRAWRTLAATALLEVSSGYLLCQSPAGSLAGKLTDVVSRPLDGVTVTLKNTLTGTEVRTVTGKGGTYRFVGLAPGQYSLVAASPELGTGNAGGVYIAEGHESRVLTAVALSVVLSRQVDSTAGDRPITEARAASGESARPALRSVSTSALATENLAPVALPQVAVDWTAKPTEMPATESADADGALAPEPTAVLHLMGAFAPPSAALPPAGNGPGAAVAVAAASAAKLLLMIPALPAEIAVPHISTADTLVISGEQMGQLPLPGRHWESFLLDSPAENELDDAGGAQSRPVVHQSDSTVDGASTRLAFGDLHAGRMGAETLAGPRSETSIQEFRVDDGEGAAASAATGERVHLESRSGFNGLHGQAFLYDRQNVLGARNPFTQWVKESAPGTLVTTPVFTAIPYSPGDTENRWGAGVGGDLRRNRLFWFAGIDGDRRNNPAISSVKHPDHFFAEPSNDEMQVLSARLGLSGANPVAEGVQAYSGMLESLAGLLGPAARTSQHWSGFGRLDGKVGERHHLTLEGTGAAWNSPGGGLSRASETFGTHSFGSREGSNYRALARWEAFLTPNLLAVTQGSMGRVEVTTRPETPSPFEQTFNANLWGQLPQMTVDSRYGFTIGNPARFGQGSSPDEHVYQAQETLNWVRGPLLVKAGFDLRHSADATSLLRNHTGTYFYSSVENFASDALVFAKFGLTDALDPMQQHNCDQRGKAWRDSAGQLHGLGYLPCYSYYRQTLGPTNWHLSTNDWAGFTTVQWQPAKQLVMTASLRWDREETPPPIALVNNPDLPLTQHLPSLSSEWSPRVGVAWGRGESRWPVLRAGYGMYAGRTSNGVLETALTQTGSLKGDLNFFMRPTDNLQFKGGGAPPFPYAFAGPPASVEKPGVVEFAPNFHNAEIHQGVAEMEATLPGRILVTVSALVSLARRLPVTMDTNYDPAANPKTITYAVVDGTGKGPIKSPHITVPFFASWPGATGNAGRLNANYQQLTELMSRANSTYEAAALRVSRNASRGLSFHARYTYGHAMDWNPNESGQAVSASTLDFLRDNASAARPDLIVVDPPRTGLGVAINDLLIQTAAPRMVYVSCDPATLARDLRALLAGGYTLASVTLADLFPQTFHLETVVHLVRS